jgi:hypothetical protein
MLTVIVLAAAPGMALAGASGDNLLDLAAKGGPSASLGFGVSPLHRELIAPLAGIPTSTAAESRKLADQEPFGKAVSFDAFTSSRMKAPATGVPTEHELLYGVRFRY